MPVLERRHRESHPDGKQIFIVQTPNPRFSGERLGVLFHNGVGRTEYEVRAARLAEQFDYDVLLPEDYKMTRKSPFNFAVADRTVSDDNDIHYETGPAFPLERPFEE